MFGSKINALLGRAAARDLYDVDNMVFYGVFDPSEFSLLRKCLLLYMTVGGSKQVQSVLDLSAVDSLTFNKIRQTLLPVLRKSDGFELESAKKRVKQFVNELLELEPEEQAYLREFAARVYKPELLFDDQDIVNRIKNHPMALWKTREDISRGVLI